MTDLERLLRDVRDRNQPSVPSSSQLDPAAKSPFDNDQEAAFEPVKVPTEPEVTKELIADALRKRNPSYRYPSQVGNGGNLVSAIFCAICGVAIVLFFLYHIASTISRFGP